MAEVKHRIFYSHKKLHALKIFKYEENKCIYTFCRQING